ncbi:MAG: glycosyltransferase family 4 protein [Blautia sp.]|nr:glycosyltransferase family 4 protein [Blautia sp.]MCM1200772.1 glycosyltransferase family 4 protein [Bacteroides fragilis]
MHIIFVTTELATKNNSSGGLATFTANIARIFFQHGHKTGILLVTTKEQNIEFDEGIYLKNIYIDKKDWEEYDFVSKLYYPEDEKEAVLNRRELVKIRKADLVRQEIEAHNKADKVDIVHFCNHGALSIMMRSNIPYIVRISGYMNIYEGGANTPYGSIVFADNPLTISDELEIHAMKKADHVIVPSRLLADITRENLAINPTVLESPFILSEDEWEDDIFCEKLSDKKYLLFFGTLKYLKGIQVIADLAENFLGQNPEMCLVLAGNDMGLKEEDGSSVMASDYVKKKAGKFADRVLYLGRLVREQMYPVVKGADLCIFPSRIENLSNTCIEAMALGKIVVATNGASFEQLIEDRASGFLCERDNPESYLNAVNEALEMSEEDKQKMILRAAERIRLLSPDVIYDKYLEFYEKVIKEWKNK